MNKLRIAIAGGSGFIGTVLANRLVTAGHAVRVLTRSREHARDTWLLPDTDVVEVGTYDDPEVLHAVFAGCDAVVNLSGILNERGDNGEGFRRVHVDLPLRIVKACKHSGVPHLLHLSALNADSFAASYYLRSKGEAEKLLEAESGHVLKVSIFRPSVVFGPGDDFTNRFARLARLSPGALPLPCADKRFQPVYVGDVADALVKTITTRELAGQRFDLGGPDIITLAELVRYVARLSGHPVRILPLNDLLSSMQANVLEYVPGKPFSRDNLRSMEEDSVLTRNDGLATLGIVPTPMRIVVPAYLAGADNRHRYYDYRTHARRD